MFALEKSFFFVFKDNRFQKIYFCFFEAVFISPDVDIFSGAKGKVDQSPNEPIFVSLNLCFFHPMSFLAL